MKNLTFALLTGIVVCLSCGKKGTELEQKVFETNSTCCNPGPCNTPIAFKNITGKLKLSFEGDHLYTDIIVPDSLFKITDKQLPLFRYWGAQFYICNMPQQILNSTRQRSVKFDGKFIYLDIPTNTGGQIPQTSGYPVEITRIELLD